MRFLFPSLLAWALLGLVPVVLYLVRHRPRVERVSTLLFFQSLAREYQEAVWWRKLKRILSFLLTLLVILMATAALARLVFAPSSGAIRNVVVLIDRSASMAAADEGGETRLDAAVEAAKRFVGALHGGCSVNIPTVRISC